MMLFVVYTCRVKTTGNYVTGRTVIEWPEPVVTMDHIEDIEEKLAIARTRVDNVQIVDWRRMEKE